MSHTKPSDFILDQCARMGLEPDMPAIKALVGARRYPARLAGPTMRLVPSVAAAAPQAKPSCIDRTWQRLHSCLRCGAWIPVFSSSDSTTEPLGAWRYSAQIALTFWRNCSSGLCNHCRTR
jgi:hypothetical protein